MITAHLASGVKTFAYGRDGKIPAMWNLICRSKPTLQIIHWWVGGAAAMLNIRGWNIGRRDCLMLSANCLLDQGAYAWKMYC